MDVSYDDYANRVGCQHAYAIGARALDTTDNTRWKCLVAHTSPGTGTFAAARTAAPTQWTLERASDNVSFITGPVTAPTPIQNGHGLTHIWKHANRLFFVQGGTMNAWCLPVHAVGGELVYIPLSGATKRGGSLLFGASWSVDTRLRAGRQVRLRHRPRRGRHLRRYRSNQLQRIGGRRAATTSRGHWARTRTSSWAATF